MTANLQADARVEEFSFPLHGRNFPKKLSYFPNESQIVELHNEFRFWHTESLLNQSANLIDQCLKDLTQLKQLELVEFTLTQEINLAEKEFEIEVNRLDAFSREVLTNENYRGELTERIEYDQHANANARALTEDIDGLNYGQGEQAQAQRVYDNKKNLLGYYQNFAGLVVQKWQQLLNQKKLAWSIDDKVKNLELFEFRKNQLEIKKQQLEKTKALDFSYQKFLCFLRLRRNYNDALDRAVIAEDGLSQIYGYSISLRSNLSLYAEDDIEGKATELHNWIYESVKSVMAYSQLDQSFTVCFSLRSVLSAAAYETLLNETNVFRTNFMVSRDLFPIGTHQNIRFKGIGASLIGEVGTTPWKIEIGLPKRAVYLRRTDDFEINQSNVPNCILGRVENRNSIRGIEFGGMVSLNNISPIACEGDDLAQSWSIQITKPKSNNETFQSIEDVIFELNLTGRCYDRSS